jgi:hypothetical protein
MTTPKASSLRNPFSLGLTTELLEEPSYYKKAFSERILVSETLSVLQPVNTIITGPQGTGKSMILNLLRYRMLKEFLATDTVLPTYLREAPPFLGISINLTRAGFSSFGKRSIAKALTGAQDRSLELNCAADYLTHYLFREFVSALLYCYSENGKQLREWLGLGPCSSMSICAKTLLEWPGWSGYYSACQNLDDLLLRCEKRLDAWRTFLAGSPTFPQDIVDTFTPIHRALHMMGDALRALDPVHQASLYITIDQYEELIGLNDSFGTDLQRIINTLIHSRDPVVFYKMGVRTYDWGRETRISGSEIRIERQRDYVQVELAEVLIKTENSGGFGRDSRGWVFAQLAEDVAVRRIQCEGKPKATVSDVRNMFSELEPHKEAGAYLKRNKFAGYIYQCRLPKELQLSLERLSVDMDAMDLHLAIAWSWQCVKRSMPLDDIISSYKDKPWINRWWHKERVELALIQLASANFQRRRFFGWNTIVYLSGGNISAFLLIFSMIWDALLKQHADPLSLPQVSAPIQTDAILSASRAWLRRDQGDNEGGEYRYVALGRLGSAIRRAILDDKALSNPGHSGFSLRDDDLLSSRYMHLANILNSGVKWALLEVRPHRSKQRIDGPRHKWYLHPLLSPSFEIPFKRVKEPLYVNNLDVVERWFFGDGPINFVANPPLQRSRKLFSDE